MLLQNLADGEGRHHVKITHGGAATVDALKSLSGVLEIVGYERNNRDLVISEYVRHAVSALDQIVVRQSSLKFQKCNTVEEDICRKSDMQSVTIFDKEVLLIQIVVVSFCLLRLGIFDGGCWL